ncbi:hypothetical protein J7L81_03395 [Candidatus Aerophobetes bacterium]|nr:hypothetical protein [Candidatus Aerophobetes bacterium]
MISPVPLTKLFLTGIEVTVGFGNLISPSTKLPEQIYIPEGGKALILRKISFHGFDPGDGACQFRHKHLRIGFTVDAYFMNKGYEVERLVIITKEEPLRYVLENLNDTSSIYFNITLQGIEISESERLKIEEIVREMGGEV